MVRKQSFSTTALVVQTSKSSVKHWRRRQVYQVKKDRKAKKKKGDLEFPTDQKKKLKQSNLNGDLVESLDIEGFRDLFQVQHSLDVARIGFQNCGPQHKSQHTKKSQDGAMAVSSGKYDVMLVAEHGLYPPKLESSDGWHDQRCMTMKGSYSRLSYNTNDGDSTAWNQYGGTSVTLTADMKSRMASKGADPTKVGRWTWVRMEVGLGELVGWWNGDRVGD